MTLKYILRWYSIHDPNSITSIQNCLKDVKCQESRAIDNKSSCPHLKSHHHLWPSNNIWQIHSERFAFFGKGPLPILSLNNVFYAFLTNILNNCKSLLFTVAASAECCKTTFVTVSIKRPCMDWRFCLMFLNPLRGLASLYISHFLSLSPAQCLSDPQNNCF